MRTTQDFLFTSESVTEGHPDKVSDQISDAVLDAAIAVDPMARVACEALVATNVVVLGGEISLPEGTSLGYDSLVRDVIRGIGYVHQDAGFDADSVSVISHLNRQSPDIAMGVDTGGAGDQGLMFGYACRETPELMPMPIMLAHAVTHRLAQVRKDGAFGFLRPDGKSQVTVEYRNGRPERVHTVVVATQHSDDVSRQELRDAMIEHVVRPAIQPSSLIDENTIFHVNPTGRFVTGGPHGDCGVTGRKIIVDTYGGAARHGGGAFSGKDPTKVDRSATYMARYVAKNAVAAGLADKLEVQLAYAIGVAEPVSVHAETFGTGVVEQRVLEEAIRQVFRLTPSDIIRELDLRRPIYRATATYGHFGRSGDAFTWERADRTVDLRLAAGLAEEMPAASGAQ